MILAGLSMHQMLSATPDHAVAVADGAVFAGLVDGADADGVAVVRDATGDAVDAPPEKGAEAAEVPALPALVAVGPLMIRVGEPAQVQTVLSGDLAQAGETLSKERRDSGSEGLILDARPMAVRQDSGVSRSKVGADVTEPTGRGGDHVEDGDRLTGGFGKIGFPAGEGAVSGVPGPLEEPRPPSAAAVDGRAGAAVAERSGARALEGGKPDLRVDGPDARAETRAKPERGVESGQGLAMQDVQPENAAEVDGFPTVRSEGDGGRTRADDRSRGKRVLAGAPNALVGPDQAEVSGGAGEGMRQAEPDVSEARGKAEGRVIPLAETVPTVKHVGQAPGLPAHPQAEEAGGSDQVGPLPRTDVMQDEGAERAPVAIDTDRPVLALLETEIGPRPSAQAEGRAVEGKPVVPPLPASQAIVQAALAQPDGPVTVTLAPEELGSLRFEIQGRGDAIHVSLTVERPDTLDLLRRHVDQLASDFRQAGYSGASFSFSGAWGGGQERGARHAYVAGGEADEFTPPKEARIVRAGLDLRL